MVRKTDTDKGIRERPSNMDNVNDTTMDKGRREKEEGQKRKYKTEMMGVVALAAKKVKKEEKGETNQEKYTRIWEKAALKTNKSIKRDAKKAIKKKEIKKMTTYFPNLKINKR
jgi:hypothetical protein